MGQSGENMENSQNCSIFTRCSAPICPLCLNGGEIFFADEPICSKHGMVKLFPWIKTQRKLAKKSEQNHEIGYFTLEMLTKIRKVSRGTAGMNPDTPGRKAKFERKVASIHERKYISPPGRTKTLREHMAKMRLAKKRVLEEK